MGRAATKSDMASRLFLTIKQHSFLNTINTTMVIIAMDGLDVN